MKNYYLLAALYVVLMGFYANPTEAQPEIRYPNHAYLYWDEPRVGIRCLQIVQLIHLAIWKKNKPSMGWLSP